MNKFLVFASILATSIARPDGLLHGQDGHVSVTHNTIGTYKYNVHLRDSFRSEERFPDGSVVGEYTINDANGVPQTFKYTAGEGGFRIIDGPLPIAPLPVVDTPEVIAARSAFPISASVPVVAAPVHFAPASVAPVQFVPAPLAPVHFAPVPVASSGLVLPVEDTPEVRAAKASFFTAYNQALSRA